MHMDLVHRIRWGNVARAAALVVAVGLVVAWPRLRSDAPALPPAPQLEARATAAGPPSGELAFEGEHERPARDEQQTVSGGERQHRAKRRHRAKRHAPRRRPKRRAQRSGAPVRTHPWPPQSTFRPAPPPLWTPRPPPPRTEFGFEQ
jgi:hypothetical protein